MHMLKEQKREGKHRIVITRCGEVIKRENDLPLTACNTTGWEQEVTCEKCALPKPPPKRKRTAAGRRLRKIQKQ